MDFDNFLTEFPPVYGTRDSAGLAKKRMVGTVAIALTPVLAALSAFIPEHLGYSSGLILAVFLLCCVVLLASLGYYIRFDEAVLSRIARFITAFNPDSWAWYDTLTRYIVMSKGGRVIVFVPAFNIPGSAYLSSDSALFVCDEFEEGRARVRD